VSRRCAMIEECVARHTAVGSRAATARFPSSRLCTAAFLEAMREEGRKPYAVEAVAQDHWLVVTHAPSKPVVSTSAIR
jgi:hypothetical protein